VNIRLSNEEINMIVKGLVNQPWLEVNDLIQRLTTVPTQEVKPEVVTLPVVSLPDAPYGIKKDGTPAKRRGRKPATKRKTRQ
jgi:hypothetical protein